MVSLHAYFRWPVLDLRDHCKCIEGCKGRSVESEAESGYAVDGVDELDASRDSGGGAPEVGHDEAGAFADRSPFPAVANPCNQRSRGVALVENGKAGRIGGVVEHQGEVPGPRVTAAS